MKKILLRRQGFTLIELLIVIVIIGILAVGFAPSLLNAPKKARDGVRKGQIAGIKQAVDAYALDKNSVYPDTGKAVKCIVSGESVGDALKAYFQGGTLPQDQAPQDKAGCASGFYLKNDSDNSCYAIITKLEVGPGHALDTTIDCTKTPAESADAKALYYGVTQKY